MNTAAKKRKAPVTISDARDASERRIEARRIGNSTGFVIPREIVLRLGIAPGQGFHITEIPGGVRITSYDPAFEQTMDALDGLIDEYRDTLRTLAK